MSSSSRRHHRKKQNAIDRFLDRLRGKSSRRRHPRPRPKPESHDEIVDYLKQKSEGKDVDIPENLRRKEHESTRHLRQKKSSSFLDWFDRSSKERAYKREEKKKAKLKRKIRKDHQKRYKKKEMGPGVAERLLAIQEGKEKTKRPSFFSKKSSLYKNSAYIINSTAIFILTYLIVYLVYWLTEVFMASLYGLDSILYYYDLKFNDFSHLWTRFNILVITGLPPFLSLALGLLLHRKLFGLKRYSPIQKLFILWWALHSLNHFFGAFASGIVTDEGFGYVAAWMYMNTAIKFLFAIIMVFMLVVIGYYSKKHFLETSNSQNRVKRGNQLSFILSQALVPWIIGTVILVAVRLPHNFDYPYETLMLFSMGFIVVAAFFKPDVKPRLNMLKIKKYYTINFRYILMMIALLLFYRIMLGIGLHFIIRISISISPAWA